MAGRRQLDLLDCEFCFEALADGGAEGGLVEGCAYGFYTHFSGTADLAFGDGVRDGLLDLLILF